MRRCWIDVGFRAIRPIAVPERARLLGREVNFHDRLDALEIVLRRHRQAHWRAVLLWQRMPINTPRRLGEHRQFNICVGNRHAFSIGPRTVERTLIRGFRGFRNLPTGYSAPMTKVERALTARA